MVTLLFVLYSLNSLIIIRSPTKIQMSGVLASYDDSYASIPMRGMLLGLASCYFIQPRLSRRNRHEFNATLAFLICK
jgi:hypothetical protein